MQRSAEGVSGICRRSSVRCASGRAASAGAGHGRPCGHETHHRVCCYDALVPRLRTAGPRPHAALSAGRPAGGAARSRAAGRAAAPGAGRGWRRVGGPAGRRARRRRHAGRVRLPRRPPARAAVAGLGAPWAAGAPDARARAASYAWPARERRAGQRQHAGGAPASAATRPRPAVAGLGVPRAAALCPPPIEAMCRPHAYGP